jgi:hypothetical protein
MTKKDLKTVVVGTAVGGGLLLAIWYFLRKKDTILELNPVQVKWEGQ